MRQLRIGNGSGGNRFHGGMGLASSPGCWIGACGPVVAAMDGCLRVLPEALSSSALQVGRLAQAGLQVAHQPAGIADAKTALGDRCFARHP